MKRLDMTYEKLFLREDGRLDTPEGFYHRIWVPPDADLIAFPSYPDYEHYAGLPAVEFPVPHQRCWDTERAPEALYVSGPSLRFLFSQDGAWKRWQLKTDTTDLLQDFLRLAHEDITEQHALTFAERWGPLWRCRQRICEGDFPPCFAYMENSEYCLWSPYEPVREYVIEARRVKSVLDVLIHLRDEKQHEPVPEELWNTIRYVERAPQCEQWEAECNAKYDTSSPPWYDSDAALARRNPAYAKNQGWCSLVNVVNQYVAALGQPVSTLTHPEASENPQLAFASSLGFLRVVWIEVVRTLSGTAHYYRCDGDGCGTYYERMTRKPKPGQRNYCPKCAETGHADSKRKSKALKQTKSKEPLIQQS